MVTKIDLDSAAEQIEVRRIEWESRGLTIGPVTWRDRARNWPDQVVTGRSHALEPDSVGVRVTQGDEQASVVLYAGGWADTAYWSGEAADDVFEGVGGSCDEPLSQSEFGRVLDELAARFRNRA